MSHFAEGRHIVGCGEGGLSTTKVAEEEVCISPLSSLKIHFVIQFPAKIQLLVCFTKLAIGSRK